MPLGARPDPNPGESGPKTQKPLRIDPGGISGELSKFIPPRDLPGATASFSETFPEARSVAAVDSRDFDRWLEDFPLAHV